MGVSRIVNHPGYSRRTKEFDVALVKLQTPLHYDRHVRPIEIWMGPLQHPMSCSVTGWGSTRESNVPTLSSPPLRPVCYSRSSLHPPVE